MYNSLAPIKVPYIAGWSNLVARRAHNPKVVGSNPAPATKKMQSTLSAAIFLVKRCVPQAERDVTYGSDMHFVRDVCLRQVLEHITSLRT